MTIREAGALAAGLLLVLAQANACAPTKSQPSEPPRAETPPPRDAQQTPPAPPIEQPQPKPAEPPKEDQAPKATEPPPRTAEQPKAAEPPQPPKAAEPSQPKPAAPAKPKAPEPAPPKQGAAATPSGPQRAAIVDLTSLEKRLRDTSAIGVFTKLSLKNEVDDLLERFRTFHGGRGGTTLAKLRESYDLLVLKVVSLLQDKDVTLARDISTSREALWSLLADPAKFKTL